jgi:hypothetical protein
LVPPVNRVVLAGAFVLNFPLGAGKPDLAAVGPFFFLSFLFLPAFNNDINYWVELYKLGKYFFVTTTIFFDT